MYARVSPARLGYAMNEMLSNRIRSPNLESIGTDRRILVSLVLYALAVDVWLFHDHAGLMLDDGYYYLKIAQSIAHSMGSTFDGVNPTNGYHPLWLLSLVPVFWLTLDSDVANILAAVLQTIFFAGSSAAVYLALRLKARPLAAALGVSLWVLFCYPYSVSGVEYSLHLLLITWTAYFYLSRFACGNPHTKSFFVLGVLCALTILARLDTVLLAGSIGLFLLAVEWRARDVNGRLLRLSAFFIPVTITCLVYVGANLVLFGHAVPLSGEVKRAWSEYLLTLDPIYSTQSWLMAKLSLMATPLRSLVDARHPSETFFPLTLTVGSFGAAILGLTALGMSGAGRQRGWIPCEAGRLAPFYLYGILGYVSYITIYHAQLSFIPWYYVIQPWITVVLLTDAAEGVLGFRNSLVNSNKALMISRRVGTIALVVLVSGVLLYTGRALATSSTKDDSPSNYDPLFETAQWIKSNLPAGAVVGSWNAGMIGYFSGRRVFDLDGLVNSWDFYEREQYDLCGYWERNGIEYLADYFQVNRAWSTVPSYPFYSRCAERLELRWAKDVLESTIQIRVYRIRGRDK